MSVIQEEKETESDDWEEQVNRLDGITVTYHLAGGKEGSFKYCSFAPRHLVDHLLDRLSPINPAARFLERPIFSKSLVLTSMIARWESLGEKPFGVDIYCLDWDCSCLIKFPLFLDTPKATFIDSATLEPIRIEVLRFHVCINTIFIIWSSLTNTADMNPTMAMFLPATIKDDEAKVRMAVFRRLAVWPIFGSSQACWKALEREYLATRKYCHFWPVDRKDCPDLAEIRVLFTQHSPDSVPICDLLETLIGPMICLPSVVNGNMFDPIFSNDFY